VFDLFQTKPKTLAGGDKMALIYFAERAVPPKAPEVLLVFMMEGVVMKERGGKFLESLPNNFPVCRAEVSIKGLTT
jgi:hypothetical protein